MVALDRILNRKIEYKQSVEQIGKYKVIHNTPILNSEEKDEVKKNIAIRIVKLLSND